jgi:hypothetical protein
MVEKAQAVWIDTVQIVAVAVQACRKEIALNFVQLLVVGKFPLEGEVHRFEQFIADAEVCIGECHNQWVHLGVRIAVYFDTRMDTVSLLLCFVQSFIVIIQEALGLHTFEYLVILISRHGDWLEQ